MQTVGKSFVSTHEDGRSGNDQYPSLGPGQCPVYEDRLLVLCRFLSVSVMHSFRICPSCPSPPSESEHV